MGFRPEPTVYNLSFEGTPLEGLHVKAKCCSVGEYRKMLQVAISGDGKITEDSLAQNDWILELFGKHLVEWDLDDPDTGLSVSPNMDGIRSIENRFMHMLIGAWQTALVTVPTISPEDSSDGETSEEQSLGLGNVSQNLKS